MAIPAEHRQDIRWRAASFSKRSAQEHFYCPKQEGLYEPAFLREWEEADDCVTSIGYWSLCLIQACLYRYLKDCIGPRGAFWWDSEALEAELGRKNRNVGIFERYRLLFLDDLGVDWRNGPVNLSDLEQLILTRHDLIHNADLFTLRVERDTNHAKRFPSGLFVDDRFTEMGIEWVRITESRLNLAIRLVSEFCAWLENIRCNYPRLFPERFKE